MTDHAVELIVRAVERLLIDGGAVFIAYLGYRLFITAAQAGPQGSVNRLEIHSPVARFVLSGKAPGLFFMTCGTAILIVSLLHGGSQHDVTTTTTVLPPQGSMLPNGGPAAIVRESTLVNAPMSSHPVDSRDLNPVSGASEVTTQGSTVTTTRVERTENNVIENRNENRNELDNQGFRRPLCILGGC